MSKRWVKFDKGLNGCKFQKNNKNLVFREKYANAQDQSQLRILMNTLIKEKQKSLKLTDQGIYTRNNHQLRHRLTLSWTSVNREHQAQPQQHHKNACYQKNIKDKETQARVTQIKPYLELRPHGADWKNSRIDTSGIPIHPSWIIPKSVSTHWGHWRHSKWWHRRHPHTAHGWWSPVSSTHSSTHTWHGRCRQSKRQQLGIHILQKQRRKDGISHNILCYSSSMINHSKKEIQRTENFIP